MPVLPAARVRLKATSGLRKSLQARAGHAALGRAMPAALQRDRHGPLVHPLQYLPPRFLARRQLVKVSKARPQTTSHAPAFSSCRRPHDERRACSLPRAQRLNWNPRLDSCLPPAPGMVRQSSRRHPRRTGRRARADPGGDRVLDHRRGRSQGRAVRVVLHRRGHRLHRRAPWHDLGGDRRDGAADGRRWCKRIRLAVPAGRDRC